MTSDCGTVHADALQVLPGGACFELRRNGGGELRIHRAGNDHNLPDWITQVGD